MSIPKKVKNYLDKKDLDYDEIAHKTVYTAYDAAQTMKKELKQIAKNLLVQADKSFVLVVVPANKKIDLTKIKKALGVKKVSIPKEKVMVKILKIKPGAISSFGKLHKLEVMVDKAMTQTQKAVFSTGSFTDSVFMKVKDFIRSEEAILANIAMSGGYKIPKTTKKKMKKVVKKKAGKKKASRKKPAKKKVSKKKTNKTTRKPKKKATKKTTRKKTAKKKNTKKRR